MKQFCYKINGTKVKAVARGMTAFALNRSDGSTFGGLVRRQPLIYPNPFICPAIHTLGCGKRDQHQQKTLSKWSARLRKSSYEDEDSLSLICLVDGCPK